MTRIEKVIREKMEKTEPQNTILAYCKGEGNGKRLDKRFIAKLQELTGDNTIRDRRRYGMTNIVWGNYDRTGGNQGGSLTIAWSEVNVYIDGALIEEKNIAYFSALVERNKKREEALSQPLNMQNLENAYLALIQAQKNIEAMTEYGTVFEPDRYSFETEFDLAKLGLRRS
jgi:hypothetical protein